MKGLTPARVKFCHEVAKHGNQSEAYRVAFPRSKKWSQKAVAVGASRMMSHANVSLMVSELRAKAEKTMGMNRDEWLAELAKTARNLLSADRMTALVNYGKAQGYYAPEKVEHELGERAAQVAVICRCIDERVRDADEILQREVKRVMAAAARKEIEA